MPAAIKLCTVRPDATEPAYDLLDRLHRTSQNATETSRSSGNYDWPVEPDAVTDIV